MNSMVTESQTGTVAPESNSAPQKVVDFWPLNLTKLNITWIKFSFEEKEEHFNPRTQFNGKEKQQNTEARIFQTTSMQQYKFYCMPKWKM